MTTTSPRRVTEWTEQQRQAVDQARRLLQPHFPGESLRLYVPARAVEVKLQAEDAARRMLQAGAAVRTVATKLGMSVGKVASLSRMVQRGHIGGRSTFPPEI